MMILGSTLLTENIFPFSMFLNMSPAFIMVFPLLGIVGILNAYLIFCFLPLRPTSHPSYSSR
jgi:hypothetical protein